MLRNGASVHYMAAVTALVVAAVAVSLAMLAVVVAV